MISFIAGRLLARARRLLIGRRLQLRRRAADARTAVADLAGERARDDRSRRRVTSSSARSSAARGSSPSWSPRSPRPSSARSLEQARAPRAPSRRRRCAGPSIVALAVAGRDDLHRGARARGAAQRRSSRRSSASFASMSGFEPRRGASAVGVVGGELAERPRRSSSTSATAASIRLEVTPRRR